MSERRIIVLLYQAAICVNITDRGLMTEAIHLALQSAPAGSTLHLGSNYSFAP